jgi:hypothetical protein
MGLLFHDKQGDYDAGVELMAEGLPVQYLEHTPPSLLISASPSPLLLACPHPWARLFDAHARCCSSMVALLSQFFLIYGFMWC